MLLGMNRHPGSLRDFANGTSGTNSRRRQRRDQLCDRGAVLFQDRPERHHSLGQQRVPAGQHLRLERTVGPAAQDRSSSRHAQSRVLPAVGHHQEGTAGRRLREEPRQGRAFYWVFAIATPTEDGYLSVRLKPTSGLLAAIKREYPSHRAIEQRDKCTPADSARLLVARLAELGFRDYAHFMATA